MRNAPPTPSTAINPRESHQDEYTPTVDFGIWIPLSITVLLFLAGLVLTLLPVFPGQVLVFAGIAIFQIWVPEHGPGNLFLGIALGITLFSLLLDVLLSVAGAKKYGASWKGALGAVVGGLIGIFLPPPLLWIFIGPVVGAILGEMLGGRGLGDAGRAGWGTFLGALLAMAIKMAVCFFLIGGFVLLVIRQSSEVGS